MARRRRAEKRETIPDPRFGEVLVSKFMSALMQQGKKFAAEKIVYGAFEKLQERLKQPSVEAFRKALDNVRPYVEVRSRRVGGATYQVPVEVRPERGIALAMRWIIDAARASSSGHTMIDRLSAALVDAFNETGAAIKKRQDTHRMADANKAFAHYRW